VPSNAHEFLYNGIKDTLLTTTGDAVHGPQNPADLLEGGAMG